MEGGSSSATISTITGALSTGLTTTVNNIMDALADILPVALTVIGAVLVVTIGIKVFKKIAGR